MKPKFVVCFAHSPQINLMTLLYNGVQYEVESEGDDIESINIPHANDNAKNTQVLNDRNDLKESPWKHRTIHTFLDECVKRKMLINNPKVRTHNLFMAIHTELKAKGFVFKPLTLIRKLNALKSQFLLVREHNKNVTDPKIHPVKWPYYEKMQILYPDGSVDDLNIASETTVGVEGTTKSLPLQTAKANIENSVAQVIANENPSSSLLQLDLFQNDKCQERTKNNNTFDIESFKTEMLSLENRRLAAAEKILLQLRRANKIKRELLEVNIKISEASKGSEEF